uniref:Uncharacterized protein n=1 Tax=Sphingobacterium sp. (strain 21) TaxID=743722 RepID=F4C8W5_SPHS2
MKKTDSTLPEWIAKQASLGPNISVERKQTESNSFWYLLTVCCPLIFERYAIVLHPFWINRNLKKSVTLEQPKITDNEDFERISWPDFFTMYRYPFDLQSANSNMELIVSTLWSTSMNSVMLFLALLYEQRRKKIADAIGDSRLAAEREK